MLNDEEFEVSYHAPTVVLSLDAIFSAVTPNGDTTVAPDVAFLVNYFMTKGYYVLVDSRLPLGDAVILLTSYGIHYSGLTHDKYNGHQHDLDRYVERLESHCGVSTIHTIVDEDITRLSHFESQGVAVCQVVGGCIVHQSSRGKSRNTYGAPIDVYTAGVRA